MPGEMADAMIEGACCSHCGVFFEEENGFPALCRSCWKATPKDQRKNFQLSQHPEL